MVPLRELGEWRGGSTPSKSNSGFWSNGTIPWVSPKDMKVDTITSSEDHITKEAIDRGRLSIVPSGSVLVVTRSGILQHTLPIAVTAIPVTINQDIKALVPRSKVSPKYVALALQASAGEILSSCSKQGTTVSSVETNKLLDFFIPLVSPAQQNSIVAEIEKQFSRLDEAVANLKRVKANLKRYKASVLKAAVEGRLVPTEAELARKEGRTYETGEQLLARILQERRAAWEKQHTDGKKRKYIELQPPNISNLPRLPEGWVWAATEQLGEVQLGRQRSPKNRSKDYPVCYIRAANITEDGLELSDLLDMEFSPEEQERYRLANGDLLISEASGSPNQVGKPAIWRDQMPLCCFQNTVIRLRPAVQISTYLFTCFKCFYLNGLFAKMAGGVGINHLSADKFSRLAMPLPPYAEQNRIVNEVERLLSITGKFESQLDADLKCAVSLRQSILAKAFCRTRG
jgi:type I restriction enzyme S subunit